MGDQNITRAIVYNSQSGKPIAKVILNGYNIAAENAPTTLGAMRSFKMVEGDLWDEWSTQEKFILRLEDGQITKARVAALPAEVDSFGLIEFLPSGPNT